MNGSSSVPLLLDTARIDDEANVIDRDGRLGNVGREDHLEQVSK